MMTRGKPRLGYHTVDQKFHNNGRPISDRYQHKFTELPFDFSTVANLWIAPEPHNEHKAQLLADLYKHYWRIVDCHTTPHQRAVIRLMAQGYTQAEVSTALGGMKNNSSTNKSIFGNTTYEGTKKTHGGSSKKVQAIAATDPVIQDLLRQIKEQEE